MKKGQKRGRRSGLDAQQWSAMVSGQEQSGQSVKAYCTSQGISAASFYRWQRLLKGREQEVAAFQRLEIQDGGPQEGIILELPGGVSLRLEQLPPAGWLRSLSASYGL